MGFLVAPTEPPLIKALGTVSLVPERHGVDIMWPSPTLGGLAGIQRKEWTDLIASVGDGRLMKEVEQMTTLRYAGLVIEGKPHWTQDGQLKHRYLTYTRDGYRALIRLLQIRGVVVEHSDDETDTIALIEHAAEWLEKKTHLTLSRRPKPGPDRWGKRTNKTWGMHVLQSVDGIGPMQAEAIFDAAGGKVPLQLTMSPEELRAIPGIGPKRVASLVKAFS